VHPYIDIEVARARQEQLLREADDERAHRPGGDNRAPAPAAGRERRGPRHAVTRARTTVRAIAGSRRRAPSGVL
jgi:hypothetical protein